MIELMTFIALLSPLALLAVCAYAVWLDIHSDGDMFNYIPENREDI